MGYLSDQPLTPDRPQRITAAVYCGILLGVASLNLIPGLKDDQGRICGIFALDLGDDLLHLGSALWAGAAAMVSGRAARWFLRLFGALYLGDGLLGLATGSGYLDAAIFTIGPQALDFGFRILANTPHIVLGGVALAMGLKR
jgi:hypothetical protein